MRPFILLAAGLILLGGVPLPVIPWLSAVVERKPTAVVYVYEKDDTAVPVGVTVGLDRLNRERGVVATLLEDDSTDGDGDVPEQYVAALEAARREGLPAIVVLSGSTVLSTTKAPTDADQIARLLP
jgi:hypothetical protein